MSKNKQFNIFEVAKIWKAEEIHTSILAELINPQSEAHDYGQAFLDMFIQTIGLDKHDFIGATITTEERTKGDRRIDMVISSDTHYIPFEVKIWAKDQPNQLRDYFCFAKETKKKVPFIAYLTPKTRKPSDDSMGTPEDGKAQLDACSVKCITFEKQILPWLQQCMDEKPKRDVLEILHQLHHNIEKNIVRNYEDPLLTEICEDTACSKRKENRTECTPKYRTYTLKKQEALEIALRIEVKNNDNVKLIIICGVEDDGKPNYAIAHLYIKEASEKFTQLMEAAFPNDTDVNKNPKNKMWARWQRSFRRDDSETRTQFAKRCCEGINIILEKCPSTEIV